MEEEHKPKYVLGIEGSANKVGVGNHSNIKGSWTSVATFSPTLAKHLLHHLELDSFPDKQQNIILNKLFL